MKPKYTTILFLLALFLIASTHACKKKPDNPIVPPTDTLYTLTPDTLIYPPHFPAPELPADNMPAKERYQLGRMLYYDTILSNDGRACAGCHIQNYGFSAPALYKNVMPVLPHENLAWYKNFMWDGSKTGTLEDLMLFEVTDFFGTDLSKINASTKYKPLFKKYFRVDNITRKEIAYALAQYVRKIITRQSKYDLYMQGLVSLTPDEYYGYRIFFTETGDCFHCHSNPVMSDNQMHNTGLDSLYTKDADKGYFNVTGNTNDLGKFRTANLRNVAQRNYYMHDGRFTTLQQVIAPAAGTPAQP